MGVVRWTLAAIDPYQPLFLGLAVLCLVAALRRLSMPAGACAAGAACKGSALAAEDVVREHPRVEQEANQLAATTARNGRE